MRRPRAHKITSQWLRPRRIKHKSAHFLLRIGSSRIHRLGVFAVEQIPAGREVIEYTGKRLSQKQAAGLRPPHDDYVIGSSLSCLLDGRTGGSGAEFINHSCDPNLLCRQSRSRFFFWSRRPIHPGEELTICYEGQMKVHRVPCLCGARKCRGTLRYIVESNGSPGEHRALSRTPKLTTKVAAMESKRPALRRIRSKFARYALSVGRSGIHRTGVYALEDIPARRFVIEYTGKKLSYAQAARLKFPRDIYAAETMSGCVDGAVGGSGAELINNGCDPNLNPLRTGDRLFLISRRKIKAGEELTWHYGYPIKPRRIACRCGARNCRKTLRVILS